MIICIMTMLIYCTHVFEMSLNYYIGLENFGKLYIAPS